MHILYRIFIRLNIAIGNQFSSISMILHIELFK
jgi:hypothetical protein